jgi:hypothetical protein
MSAEVSFTHNNTHAVQSESFWQNCEYEVLGE